MEKASLVPVALPAKQPVIQDLAAARIPADEKIIQSVIDKIKHSPWYHGTNGCPIIGSDNMMVQRRTDRQTDSQTD